MAFRIFDPFRVFFNDLGEPLAGGEIRFFNAGTTTPKVVYGDKDLTVNNGSTVPLDSAGRANVDVWGSGDYFAELYDAGGVKVDEADNIELPGGSGTSIPALVTGEFLTNDGANLQWDIVRQVPDPSGNSGKILGNDGVNLLWQDPPAAPPAPPDPEIVITGNSSAGSFRAGTSASTAKYFRQWGGASAPSNPGGKTTSVAVTYATPFDATPRVVITPVGNSFTNAGYMTDFGVTSESASGFTATFNTNHGESNSDANINVSIPFNWSAEGIKTV